jgi:hypothetical protein
LLVITALRASEEPEREADRLEPCTLFRGSSGLRDPRPAAGDMQAERDYLRDVVFPVMTGCFTASGANQAPNGFP